MAIEEAVVEKLRALPPERQQEVLEFIEELERRGPQQRPLKSVKGLWADLGVTITDEDIDEDIAEARREMWGNSETAEAALDAASAAGDPIYLASISLVELRYLVHRGRLPETAFQALDYALVDPSVALQLVQLDHAVARAVGQIPRNLVPDMPDRAVIVRSSAPRLPGGAVVRPLPQPSTIRGSCGARATLASGAAWRAQLTRSGARAPG